MILRSLIMLAAMLPPGLETSPEPLSLEAALLRAIARNPELRAARERSTASSFQVDVLRNQKFPRIGIEMSAQRTDNAAAVFAHRLNSAEFTSQDFGIARLNAPSAISHLGTSLFVEMPVDLGGRIGLEAAGQAAKQRAFSQSLREAEATLRLEVTEAYFGVLLAREAKGAAERGLRAARAREETTQARFVEGVALQADVLRVRARRRIREADLSSQRAEQAAAESRLARLLGAEDGARFEIAGSPGPALGLDTVETWKQRAVAGRAALQAVRELREGASVGVRIERRTSWPELAAQARLMDDRTAFSGGGRSWLIGAALRWNLFDATREKRVAGALAEERAAALDEQAAQDRVRFEVEVAFERAGAAKERLAAAIGGREEGQEALRVVQERRAQGLATLTDELETEAAAYAAELEEISAARAAVLAEMRLQRAAGVDLRSVIQ